MNSILRVLFAVVAPSVLLVGCGGQARAPVSGHVTLNGQPVAQASIMLSPGSASAPGPFIGTTDTDGKFVLGSPDDADAGAVPGEYRLFITTVKSEANEMAAAPAKNEIVPARWRNGSQRFTVPAGGTSEANFELGGQ